MRLVYDNIVFAIQKYGGISVVWQELLQRLQKFAQFELKYLDTNQTQYYNYFREKLNIADEDILSIIDHAKYSRYFPVRLKADVPFLFHSSYYRYCTNPNAINITTVHDFTYELYNGGLKQKVHSWQKNSAIRHSAHIVCISENTKKDLLRFLPDVDESKVSVIYNGVSDVYNVLKDKSRDDISLLPFPSKSYVIFVGRRDSYKNFDLVVKGVAATNLNFLIVGSPLNEAEIKSIDFLLSPERYRCMSHVKDEQLNILYNHSAALVYPSSYEGFGLPVLEAQRAGCPVIALNASSIPEVIDNTPLLMQKLSVEELKSKLDLLKNQEIINQVRLEGITNSMQFSWQRMAGQYLELYQNIANGTSYSLGSLQYIDSRGHGEEPLC